MCGIRPPGYRDLFLTQHPARAVRCRLYAANGADRSKLELAARDDHFTGTDMQAKHGVAMVFCRFSRSGRRIGRLQGFAIARAVAKDGLSPSNCPPLGNAVADFAALEDARRRCGCARQGERNYRCGSLRCRVNFTSRSLHVDKGAAGRRQGSAGLDRRRHRCAGAIGRAVL